MADSLAFVDDFKAIGSAWHVAEYDFSHPAFDSDWRRSQVLLDKGIVLRVTPQSNKKNRFIGGSLRRVEPSHFGRYDVTMQAARGEGLVTGFFTYTGPHYGTQHDEIDIEFLGRDTTKMHVAWFVDGSLTNRFIELGFDAADRPREYAFEWLPDRLRWFAEGQMIFEHRATQGPIPQTPGMLFVNLWAADPSIQSWAGTSAENLVGEAKVLNLQFTPYDNTR